MSLSEINYTSYTILFLYYYIDIQGFKDQQFRYMLTMMEFI